MSDYRQLSYEIRENIGMYDFIFQKDNDTKNIYMKVKDYLEEKRK